jgi:hypothetical protein
METTFAWKIGDKCYCAHATMNGRSCDGGFGFSPTADIAIDDARSWFGNLTERERRYADCWVREYIVSDVEESEDEDDDEPDDYGATNTVGAASSTPAAIWQLSDDSDDSDDDDSDDE